MREVDDGKKKKSQKEDYSKILRDTYLPAPDWIEPQRRFDELMEMFRELEFVEKAINTMDAFSDAIFKIRCFDEKEAKRIEKTILAKRPDLRKRFFTTWLTFAKNR